MEKEMQKVMSWQKVTVKFQKGLVITFGTAIIGLFAARQLIGVLHRDRYWALFIAGVCAAGVANLVMLLYRVWREKAHEAWITDIIEQVDKEFFKNVVTPFKNIQQEVAESTDIVEAQQRISSHLSQIQTYARATSYHHLDTHFAAIESASDLGELVEGLAAFREAILKLAGLMNKYERTKAQLQ